MEAFFVSTLAVTLSEIGDKTQLLALLLAAKFKKPVAVILGILAATLLNHATAGLIGSWVATNVSETTLRWILAISFIAVAIWALKPDSLDDNTSKLNGYGAFTATLIAFFLAEIGDKTQVATMMLAAKFNALAMVVAGTTLGMMIVDIPTVYLGNRFAAKLPLKTFRYITAALFAILGVLVLLT